MRGVALLAMLLWQAAPGNEPPVARPVDMRYQRALSVPAGAGQACAVLDAAIFPHAVPSLKDLRIFPLTNGPAGDAGAREVPYAITLSEAVTEETQAARVLNLGSGGAGGRIVFDLEMPARAYTGVTLDLDPDVHDFIATATVTGMDALGGGARGTALGEFTLFDLTAQRLSRDTTLPLEESTFRYLHVVLNVAAAPGSAAAGRFVPSMVEGAEVPPSRTAQIVYTTVATVTAPTTGALASPRKTRFDIALPLRVPVERVSFDISPTYAGNFSRDVTINASGGGAGADVEPGAAARTSMPLETVSGTILRVHSTQGGRRISEQHLSVPAVLGSNLQTAAHVWVEVENGDDQPLPIAAVRLEMRQRKVCFDVPASGGAGLALFYGDPRLAAPVYDYERLFAASNTALAVGLGAEGLNADYRPPAEEERPFTERHPEVLWIALIVVICVLGVVALRAGRGVGR